MEHALPRLAGSRRPWPELGLDAGTSADVHVALQEFLLCTADAPEMARLAGGDNLALMAAFAPVYMGSAGEGLERWCAPPGGGSRCRARPARGRGAGTRARVSHCEVGRLASASDSAPG